MDIPVIFAQSGRGDEIRSLTLPEGRCIPSSDSADVPLSEAIVALPRTESRQPVVIADWGSIRSRRFKEGVVKGMKVRGRDIWLMIWIEDADDLMDAFNTVADTVMAPLHAISGKEDLKDICSLSDSVIPTVFCTGGRAMGMGSRRSDLTEVVPDLVDMGFYRICVIDPDDSVDAETWDVIRDICPSCMPLVSDRSIAKDFADVIVPLRLRSLPLGTPPRHPGRLPCRPCPSRRPPDGPTTPSPAWPRTP